MEASTLNIVSSAQHDRICPLRAAGK